MNSSDFFFIIGAPTAGTTTLYEWLRQHPDLEMSVPKETRWFEDTVNEDLEAFADSFFGRTRDHGALVRFGEATPSYLQLPYVADHLPGVAPDARFITLVRDPVRRAYASWWSWRMRAAERLGFAEAIEANLQELQEGRSFVGIDGERAWQANREVISRGEEPLYRTYVDGGYYADHLDRWMARVGDGRMLVVLLEDLHERPRETLRDVARFLEVTQAWADDVILTRVNQAHSPLTRPIYRLIKQAGLYRIAHRSPLALRRAARRVLARLGSRPAMDRETRALLADHFAPHNARLAERLDRDLSHWG